MISEIRLKRKVYKPVNGFSRFPNKHQALSIFLLIIKILAFTLLLLPFKPASAATIALSTGFYALAGLLVGCALACYLIDPVDPCIHEPD
jgi:hypothetical protein